MKPEVASKPKAMKQLKGQTEKFVEAIRCCQKASRTGILKADPAPFDFPEDEKEN